MAQTFSSSIRNYHQYHEQREIYGLETGKIEGSGKQAIASPFSLNKTNKQYR